MAEVIALFNGFIRTVCLSGHRQNGPNSIRSTLTTPGFIRTSTGNRRCRWIVSTSWGGIPVSEGHITRRSDLASWSHVAPHSTRRAGSASSRVRRGPEYESCCVYESCYVSE